MKNRMEDVRNHLVAMLEALGDDCADGQVIERAKAASQVANSFIGAVKVEIDAMRLADEIGILPTSVDAQTLPGRRQLQAVGGRG